ncbi:MAG: D-alanyl-D-alanine carboxypeptidase family protein [Acidimicrobiales bacterium]|nr:D-alanyl-D-alanine carboxypeptidase family protein [Acidimicrobiales bacterium]
MQEGVLPFSTFETVTLRSSSSLWVRLSRGLLVLLALAALAVPVGAQEDAPPETLPENPYDRLAEIQRRKAEAALKADLLRLSAVEVEQQLAQVEAWVAAQSKVVEAAQAELVEATLAAEQSRIAEQAKADELGELRDLMREVAVAAFVRPQATTELEMMLDQDLDAAAKAGVMLRAKSDHDHEVADRLARAEADLRKLRRTAEEHERRAEVVADQAATELGELQAAKLEQVALAERIQFDLAETTDELQTLGGAEAEAALAVQQATEALLARATGSSIVPLVDVRGIKVHADIAQAVEALLAAAEADGVILQGWGYRTTESQVSLRRQHCGGEGLTDADVIYAVAPASCSPPTAKPGTSMHELGLAIDFTHDGASISSHDSPAYQWLAEHAGSFGLRNLPSEPWHWSVNGK